MATTKCSSHNTTYITIIILGVYIHVYMYTLNTRSELLNDSTEQLFRLIIILLAFLRMFKDGSEHRRFCTNTGEPP